MGKMGKRKRSSTEHGNDHREYEKTGIYRYL